MFGFGHQLQVGKRVVGCISINVVNMLVAIQISTKVLLHHQAVFIHTIVDGLWMTWRPHKDVSARTANRPTASPIGVFDATLTSLVPAGLRAKASSYTRRFVLQLARIYLEILFAFLTGKRDAFSSLPLISLLAGQRSLEDRVAVAGTEVSVGEDSVGWKFEGLVARLAGDFYWHYRLQG